MRPWSWSAAASILLLCLQSAASAQPPNITSGPNYCCWSIGEVNQELTADSGIGTYTWSLVGGSLPPGISIRTDVPSYFPASASAGLIGVATSPGTYNFILQVTSGGQSVTQSASMHISALILKDFSQFPDAFVNVPYPVYQLTAINNAGPMTYAVSNGTLPPGMNLSASGILSGTPTAPGNYNWTIQFTDGVDTEYRGFNINVYAVDIETPGELPNATQNAPYSVTVSASGGAGGYTFTTSGLPNGLTLSSSGIIAGTVTGGPGRSAFSLTATDSNGASYSKQMSITVIGGTQFPGIALYGNGNSDDCTIGTPCGRNGYAGGGVPPYSWTATGLPTGMAIRFGSGTTSDYVIPGDFELWGSPTALGAYNVQLTVTDSTGAATTSSFPLKVSSLIADYNASLLNGVIGVSYSLKLRVVGGSGPYAVTQNGGWLADGLSLNSQDLVVSGDPMENGNFFAVFEFTDAAANSIQVTNYYAISGGTSTVDIGTFNNLGVWPVGSNPDLYLYACCASNYVWSVVQGSLPPGLDLSPSGNLSGTLSAPGTYTFLVRSADGSNAGYRQFVMTVTPIGVTTATTLPYGNVGAPYTQALTASGGTGALNWSLAQFNYLPAGLSLSGSGSLSGVPTQTGQFQFNVNVTDAAGNIGMASFNMAVYPAPLTGFVAPTGNDANPGTIAQPYLTIGQCVTAVFGGSTCMVRAGTYHETVTPNSGITIMAYNGETVTVDGTDPVTNWTLHGGSIYRASVTLNSDDTNQLFVGTDMMTEARWPNGDNLFLVNWANTEAGTDDSHLVDSHLPDVNWTGAKVHLLSGTDPWSPQTATVTGSSKGQLNITLDDQDYSPYIQPQAGGFYYLYRSFVALDKQGEWFYDSNKNVLYFWAPGNVNPNTLQVHAKHRQFCFDLSGRSNVTIQNISLFGCGINMNASSANNVLSGIDAQYLSQFTDMPAMSPNSTSYWYTHYADSGIVLNGSGNILRNSTLAWSAGNGVSLMGSSNTVTNNLIYNTGYAGNDSGGVTLFGTGHTVTENTIHTGGRVLITIWGVNPDNNDIGYNNLFNAMLLSLDAGEIYSGEANVTGTRIHHNWLHDTQTPIPFGPGVLPGLSRSGVYLDEDSTGFEVDQNVLWNNEYENINVNASNANVTPMDNYIHNNSIPDVAPYAYIRLFQILHCGTMLVQDNLVFEPVTQPGTNPPCMAVDNNATAPGATDMTAAVHVGCNFAGCSSSGPPAVSGTSISPSIALQPFSVTVEVGQTATFSVTAEGSPPLTYQWRQNGTSIPGANTASYTTPAVSLADNGALFTVKVSSPHGSVVSSAATLSVETP